jgi:hypothetical protein
MTDYRSRKDGSHYPISKRRVSTGTMQKGTAHLSVPKRLNYRRIIKTDAELDRDEQREISEKKKQLQVLRNHSEKFAKENPELMENYPFSSEKIDAREKEVIQEIHEKYNRIREHAKKGREIEKEANAKNFRKSQLLTNHFEQIPPETTIVIPENQTGNRYVEHLRWGQSEGKDALYGGRFIVTGHTDDGGLILAVENAPHVASQKHGLIIHPKDIEDIDVKIEDN